MIKRSGTIAAFVTILAVSLFTHFHLRNLEAHEGVDVAIEDLPMTLGDWKGRESEGMSIRSQEILRLTRYVRRDYVNPAGKSVSLYVGYWKKQTGEYQAAKHSPVLCLPSNGWDIERKPPADLSFGGGISVTAKRILGEFKGRPFLFYYWFFTGEQNYSEEWRALVDISLQKFFYGRSDGGIIEVSLPLEGGKSREASEAEADATVKEFLAALYPELHKLIVPDAQTKG